PARLIAELREFYSTPPLTSAQFPWPEDLS
ncbi:MAG TPA: elongation factor P hydroxylase, partial [Erwinia persicina]|nr:elongation factor P hydroxylase [Erwinia persicina]